MTAEPSRRPRRGKTAEYTAASIQVLEGLQAVRKRPGMYIGSTDARGLHQLVWEVVDNSIDEAMANAATRIDVTIHADGRLEVVDDGRGIPVDKHTTGQERPRGRAHRPPRRRQVRRRRLQGLRRPPRRGRQRGERALRGDARRGPPRRQALDAGVPARSAARPGAPATAVLRGEPRPRSGLEADDRHPDLLHARPSIFETLDFNWETIATRLRESAYLNKGLWIRLVDERVDREKNFYFEGGVTSFVRHLNRRRERAATHVPCTWSAWSTAPASRSRCSTTTASRRTSCPSPTTSTPSTAARTSPGSAPR